MKPRVAPRPVRRPADAARGEGVPASGRLEPLEADPAAFRPGMAVHGRYGKPCPACQTGGKLLADRALSRLLKRDWPRTLDEWEVLKDERRDRGNGDVKEVS